MRVRRRKYDAEFRRQAVDLFARSERTMADIAASLGIPKWTLRDWYHQDMARRTPKPAVAVTPLVPPAEETIEQKVARLEREIATLRKENADLKVDKEILKKAGLSSTGQRYTGA
jgi:transposase